MGAPFMFQSNSNFGRRWRSGLLEIQDVENGQNARDVEDGQADEPRQLVVARTLPQGDQLPYPVPDRQEDDHDDKYDQQRTFHIGSLVLVVQIRSEDHTSELQSLR